MSFSIPFTKTDDRRHFPVDASSPCTRPGRRAASAVLPPAAAAPTPTPSHCYTGPPQTPGCVGGERRHRRRRSGLGGAISEMHRRFPHPKAPPQIEPRPSTRRILPNSGEAWLLSPSEKPHRARLERRVLGGSPVTGPTDRNSRPGVEHRARQHADGESDLLLGLANCGRTEYVDGRSGPQIGGWLKRVPGSSGPQIAETQSLR